MADGTITIDINANENVSDSLNKIKGDAKSLEGNIKGVNDGTSKFAGYMGKLAKATTFAYLGKKVYDFGKSCVEAYSEFEQLSGGIQQLFGKDAPRVLNDANKAFKSAGMSANEYMSTASNFSAKLISDLGSTEKAADYVNKAVIQMSDNANTFGTSMDEVQRAYQSMARGNYAMLDSLKLGLN